LFLVLSSAQQNGIVRCTWLQANSVNSDQDYFQMCFVSSNRVKQTKELYHKHKFMSQIYAVLLLKTV